MWTNSIVRDELSRPLIVSDHELHQIEYDEAKIKKRLLKYAHQQMDNVNKMIDEKEHRVCKTVQGEEIRVKQLENLRNSKVKLHENLASIDKRTPYIDVKVAVKKIF